MGRKDVSENFYFSKWANKNISQYDKTVLKLVKKGAM